MEVARSPVAHQELDAAMTGIGADAGDRASWVPRSAAHIAQHGVPPVKWDVEGLIPAEDGPLLLIGAPSAHKSWMALELARCAVTGDPFAGRFRVHTRPFAIFVNLDAGKNAIERRVQMTGCDDSRFLVVSPTEWDPEEFRALLAAHPGAWVTIDCLSDVYRAAPDQDPAEGMRTFLRGLRAVFAEFGANGVVIDHAKRQSNGRTTGPEYYGSVQKKGAIRQMWIVEPIVAEEGEPTTRVRVLCEKLSEAERFLPFGLEFAFTETSVTVTAVDGAFAKPETAIERAERELLSRVDRDGPVTRSALGADSGNTKRAFDNLRDTGKIVATGTHAGRAPLYWTPARIDSQVKAGLPLDQAVTALDEKRDNDAGSSLVNGVDQDRPGKAQGIGATAPRVSGSVASEPWSSDPAWSGSTPIGDRANLTKLNRPKKAPLPSREQLAAEQYARDGFTLSRLPCSRDEHEGRVRLEDGACKVCVETENAE